MIRANDPSIESWVEVAKNSEFPIQNLPFGIANIKDKGTLVVSRIGDFVINMSTLAEHGFFDDLGINLLVFEKNTLNDFISSGKEKTAKVRDRLSAILDTDFDDWDASELMDHFLVPIDEVEMMMPIQIGDYTDFYSSIDHATNVGTMFRDPDNALLPNWKHLPVGYHGRSSSIMVSGTPTIRPNGQQKPNDGPPVFGPSKLLDFELEMGFVVGRETQLGESVPVDQAEDFIFGMVILNDWSARDIQKWEYIPLGPFLAKNFQSTISAWVVTLDALQPFKVDGYTQTPEVLPYLKQKDIKNYDIQLEVAIQPDGQVPTTVCNSNFKYMYWTMSQQLAHHTVNGCNVRVGDMYGSGTISGPEKNMYGSMLELSWKGTNPVQLADGETRKFIQDGDTVIMKAYSEKDGVRIGFGECKSKVHPARQMV
jgi:fumarylacetoacetase